MHPYMAKIEYTPGDDYYNELKAWLEEDLNSLCLSQYRTLMTEVPTFIMSRKTPIRTPYEKAMKQMEYINNNAVTISPHAPTAVILLELATNCSIYR